MSIKNHLTYGVVSSIAIFALLQPSSMSQGVVKRNAASNSNKSLSVRIINRLSANSRATTTGNTKVFTESKISIAPGSNVTTQIGGEDGTASVLFEEELDSRTLEATGLSSNSNFILEEPTEMTSIIETIDPDSGEGGYASASSDLLKETTLDVRYQDVDSISTYQQAF